MHQVALHLQQACQLMCAGTREGGAPWILALAHAALAAGHLLAAGLMQHWGVRAVLVLMAALDEAMIAVGVAMKGVTRNVQQSMEGSVRAVKEGCEGAVQAAAPAFEGAAKAVKEGCCQWPFNKPPPACSPITGVSWQSQLPSRGALNPFQPFTTCTRWPSTSSRPGSRCVQGPGKVSAPGSWHWPMQLWQRGICWRHA
ncbi:hypothetical protein V8C86DRAFT_2530279 [Haematococcus lacustris]